MRPRHWVYQEVWPIVADPRINCFEVVKANACGAALTAPRAHFLLCFQIVDEQIDDFVRRECGDHLEIDLFDLRHPCRARFPDPWATSARSTGVGAIPPACESRAPLESLLVVQPSRVSERRAFKRKYL